MSNDENPHAELRESCCSNSGGWRGLHMAKTRVTFGRGPDVVAGAGNGHRPARIFHWEGAPPTLRSGPVGGLNSVFSLSTSTLWAKAGVPVLRLRSSVSSGLWVEWGKGWFSRWDEAAAGRAGERGCRRPKKPCRRWRPSTLARAAVLPGLGRFATWSRRRSGCKPGSAQPGGFETRAQFARNGRF